jgi:hypothetical protein
MYKIFKKNAENKGIVKLSFKAFGVKVSTMELKNAEIREISMF